MSAEGSLCGSCQKPSVFRCGGCRRVAYCSREHQKLDWKSHKAICSRIDSVRFKVAENQELGRHLISLCCIPEGDIILSEAPLVSGPLQLTPPVCLGCYKLLNRFNKRDCSRCGWPVCSDVCEKSAAHKPECNITQKYKKSKVAIKTMKDGLHHPSYQSITVLRCLYLKKSNNSAWEKISSLQSHCKERKETEKHESDLMMIARFVPRFFNFRDFTENDILKMAGIVQVNAHHVPLTEPGYISIYDKASLIEHSCQANCSKSFTDDGKIVIRASRTIQPEEHLSICYTEPLWGARARRAHLLNTKFFMCRCPRCSDPTELETHFNSLICSSDACDGYVVPFDSFWRCTVCGRTSPDEEFNSFFATIKEDASKLDRKKPEDCENFIKKHEKHLHPNHHFLVDAKLAVVECYDEEKMMNATEEGIKRVADHCTMLGGLAAKLVPAENRLRGILYFQLHCALSELGRRKSLAGEMDDEDIKRSLMIYRDILKKAYHFLKWEPQVLPEGKMATEAVRLIQDLNEILEGNLPVE